MSRSAKAASEAELGDPPSDFVLDFLYHDARRVASFLAQFDTSGHLIGLKQSETVSESEGEEGTIQATANALVARAAGTFIQRRNSSGGEASERTYDPFWVNALTFLDFLTERNLINRDITKARIGQFVLGTGPLLVADLSLLKIIWNNPTLKAQNLETELKAIVFPENCTEEMQKTMQREVELGHELIPGLPHNLQARLIDKFANIWCGLSEDSLVGSAADIALKHGAVVGGAWNILGILDAVPYNPNATTEDGRPFMEFVSDLAGPGGGRQALNLAQIARNSMGRPERYYGVTPLLIYRQIEGAPSSQAGPSAPEK